MRAVDVSDRALTKYFENKRSSWQAYKSNIDANPNLVCSDHEGLLSNLKEQQTELGPGDRHVRPEEINGGRHDRL